MRRSQAPSQKGQDLLNPVTDLQHIVRGDGEDTNVRRFQVIYGGLSTRKHKTYEKDGTLEKSGNNLTLRDEDGYFECSALYIPGMRFEEEFEIIMEPKEVKIVQELGRTTKRQDEAGKRSLILPPVEFKAPSEKHFQRQRCPSPNSSLRALDPGRCDIKRIKVESEDDVEESPESSAIPIPVIKEEPVEIAPTADPLERQEMVLFCRPSNRQWINFAKIYQKLDELDADADPVELLTDLQDSCNGPINRSSAADVSGKLTVLQGIVQCALDRHECVMIIADNSDVLNDLFEFSNRTFDKPSFLITEEVEVRHLAARKERSKVIITSVAHLEAMHNHRLSLHRTIVYENLAPDDEIAESLTRITRGPLYHLLICGSIEERLFQMKHRIIADDEEGLKQLRIPGNFEDPETHSLLRCDCLEGDVAEFSMSPRLNRKKEELDDLQTNWQHIPGHFLVRPDQEDDHLQVSSGVFCVDC